LNTTRVGLEGLLHRTWSSSLLFPILSSINVALSCVAVLYVTFNLSGLRINIPVLISGFLATFSIYSLNTVTDLKEDIINQPQKAAAIAYKGVIYSLSLVSYILSLIIGYVIKPICVVILLIPLLIGIIYSIEIKGFRLKNLFLGKNLSISFSWAIDASLFPFVFNKNILLFVAIFFFIFVKGIINTVLFDLRDMKGDAKANINTLPIVMGRKKTIHLLLFLNSLLILWLFFFFERMFKYFIVIVVCIIYGYIYIFFFGYSKDVPKYLYSLLIDDEWIWWMFLIMLIKIV